MNISFVGCGISPYKVSKSGSYISSPNPQNDHSGYTRCANLVEFSPGKVVVLTFIQFGIDDGIDSDW